MASSSKTVCMVKHCRNTSARNPLMAFFRLPARLERRKDWLKLMDREDLLYDKNWSQYQVCEIHFRPHYFQDNPAELTKKLTRLAVPTLFMPVEVPLEKSTDLCVPLAEASTSTVENTVKRCDVSTQTIKYEEIDDMKVKELRFKALCDKFLSQEMAEKVKSQMRDPNEDFQPMMLKKIKTEKYEDEPTPTYEVVHDAFVKTETFFT